MIRLTIHATTNPEIHLFNKSTILIGNDSSKADLLLSENFPSCIQLKIIEQNQSPVLINSNHDPFISVNGHSFGKRPLNTGDIIQIYNTPILFENLAKPSNDNLENQSEQHDTLSQMLENKIKAQESAIGAARGESKNESFSLIDFDLPFEKEVESLKEDELKDFDLNQLLQEIESSQPEAKQPSNPQLKPALLNKRSHLKDDYLKEYDDKAPSWQPAASAKQPAADNSHLLLAWKWILFFLFSVLVIALIIGSVIFLSISDKTEVQETKASQGVADIAIALAHAQLLHLKPHNQNWSDVDFLKSNLQAVLSQTFSQAADIDSHGQFHSCPYSLRIYTNRDLSHFLLIAQPAPSLLQWLIPKSAILVDSQTMELRTIRDLRSLNRLLANPDPLEGVNEKEISALIKQGTLISLSHLAKETHHTDLAPPADLADIRPGAENLIYNAPRYYRLGQFILQKAIALASNRGTSQEVASLKQDIESLSHLPGLILYCEEKKNAFLARQGLMTFAPNDKLLVGYLTLDANGHVMQGEILKEEEEWDYSSLALSSPKQDTHPLFHEKQELEVADNSDAEIDPNHPLYVRLSNLAQTRQNALAAVTPSFIHLIQKESKIPQQKFQHQFQEMSYQFISINAHYRKKLKEAISLLYAEYEDVPLATFILFLKKTGLEDLIQDNTDHFTLSDENCQQNLETLFTHIEECKSLCDLDYIIHIAQSWLTFDYLNDSNELLKFQTILRNRVLSRLEKFLLSSKQHLDLSKLNSEEHESLQRILHNEKLIQPEERVYFLEEFNRLMETEKKHMPAVDSSSVHPPFLSAKSETEKTKLQKDLF